MISFLYQNNKDPISIMDCGSKVEMVRLNSALGRLEIEINALLIFNQDLSPLISTFSRFS